MALSAAHALFLDLYHPRTRTLPRGCVLNGSYFPRTLLSIPQADGLDESGFVFLQIQRKMSSGEQRHAQHRPQREVMWLILSISQKLVCVARPCERRELLRGAVSAAISFFDIAEFLEATISECVVRSRFSKQPDGGVSKS